MMAIFKFSKNISLLCNEMWHIREWSFLLFLLQIANSFLNANVIGVLLWQVASYLIAIGNKVQAVNATHSELKNATC